MGADIIISLVGREAERNLFLSFSSEKGKQIADRLAIHSEKKAQLSPHVQRLTQERHETGKALSRGIAEKLHTLDGLMEVFDRCISCHACSSVCPICYCKNCYFESRTFRYFPESYFHRMKQKGGLRLPVDRILFHLGRLSHMGTSCVACGMCEDVCPAGIPIAQVFKTAGERIQATFEYLPGQHLDQPLPLLTFQFEELHEAED
jgi:formate dehydrogenase subunit beta